MSAKRYRGFRWSATTNRKRRTSSYPLVERDSAMTATTEPTTAPEVPAWLNLDAIIAPELREEIAEATAELDRLEKDVTRVVLHCREIGWRVEPTIENAVKAVNDVDMAEVEDGLLVVLGTVTGWIPLMSRCSALGSIFDVVGRPKPQATPE